MRRVVSALLCGVVALLLGTSVATAAPTLPVGTRLNCYHTYASSGAVSGYNTGFVASLTLHHRGPILYQVGYQLNRNTFDDHVSWSYAHRVIHFHRGFFDTGGTVVGRFVPRGATMPHSQMTAAKYTIVLRSVGEPANDNMPPSSEGTDFRKATFWYCTASKPKLIQPAPGSAPAPTPGSAPAPAPAPATGTGPHPPYGKYSCLDKLGTDEGYFTLSDPFTYTAYPLDGAFTFDQPSGRVDFQGGRYDNATSDLHLFGMFTGPGTIVLEAKVQKAYSYGPDADEVGAHTFWHCGTPAA